AVGCVVVDDEDPPTVETAGWRQGRGLRPPLEAHSEPEDTAPAELAVHADLTAHQLDQVAADCQAEPRPAIAAGGRAIGLRERLEQAIPGERRDANAGVAHLEA